MLKSNPRGAWRLSQNLLMKSKPEAKRQGSNSFADEKVTRSHLVISAIIIFAAYLFAAHIDSLTY